jgi:hypothetical protein
MISRNIPKKVEGFPCLTRPEPPLNPIKGGFHPPHSTHKVEKRRAPYSRIIVENREIVRRSSEEVPAY